jgi:hypothetical protein
MRPDAIAMCQFKASDHWRNVGVVFAAIEIFSAAALCRHPSDI